MICERTEKECALSKVVDEYLIVIRLLDDELEAELLDDAERQGGRVLKRNLSANKWEQFEAKICRHVQIGLRID